jgi:hypothetical protein
MRCLINSLKVMDKKILRQVLTQQPELYIKMSFHRACGEVVRSSRDCNWKVWGYWTHEFIAGRTDSDLHNVGKVIVVPWSIWTQVTGRIVILLQPHQQGLGLLCFTEDGFLHD